MPRTFLHKQDALIAAILRNLLECNIAILPKRFDDEIHRTAAGANLGEKLFGMVKTIGPVFQSYAPGLGLLDLAVGVAGAVILYLMVQSKIKKVRKFRRDMEYGTARCGA